ncbi:MAG: SDR family NAD(P)-dependent oxidoreductase [Polyangiaceae bacterium]
MSILELPKRILVTGASRGIGRELALLLAQSGHTTVLAARSREDLEAVAREILARGGRAEVLPMDVTDDASVARAVAELLSVGPCDVVVNNAGSLDQAWFVEQSSETQRREMEVNYWGALRVTRALLPSLLARGAGSVVNVSSLLGGVASTTTANYCATKAALEAWSFALRREVERHGVKVTVFVAPHTETEMGGRARFEGVRSLPAAYTAAELARAIDRAPRKYAGSPVYRFLLWLARVAPSFMEARVSASALRAVGAPPEGRRASEAATG